MCIIDPVWPELLAEFWDICLSSPREQMEIVDEL